jgi:ubiquinone/menaquinone biosynthesis C-methylase UbiE
MSPYVLDNAGEQTGERFAGLEHCFDPVTIRGLEATGVSDGWSCLEVGGGGGSIARWLAPRVGPEGKVVVTDINPRWLDATAENVELRRHDIVRDRLEERAFDLVHARLVLLHLPERQSALERMIGALRPGGVLMIEDFDCTWLPFVTAANGDDSRLFHKVIDAFHQVLSDGGVHIAHGRHFHRWLELEGLSDIRVEAHAQVWRGGSPGCRTHRANMEQLHDRLTGSGLVTGDEIARFIRLVEDPSFAVSSYLLVSATARRPR